MTLIHHTFYVEYHDGRSEKHTMISCSCNPGNQQLLSTMTESQVKIPGIIFKFSDTLHLVHFISLN